MGDVEDLSSLFNELLDFVLRNLTELQTECHVIENGHMGVQSVVLEYHRDISVLRSNVVNETVADEHFALGDLLKTCNHTESCGLTAAGRAYEYDELLVLDIHCEIGNGNNAAGIALVYASE